MKFKKTKSILLCMSFAVGLALLPVNSASATSNQLTLVKSEQHEYKGESFQVETWKDKNGIETVTIPTLVENKLEIAEYVNQLSNPTAFRLLSNTDWDRRLNGNDLRNSDASVSMSIYGTAHATLWHPITQHKMEINQGGSLIGYWYGSGNADKIVLKYKYQFDGWNLVIAIPPSLTKLNDVVSFTSLPVENKWYLSTDFESASVTSRIILNGVTVTGSADIYKGSNIYRPSVSSYVSNSLPNQ